MQAGPRRTTGSDVDAQLAAAALLPARRVEVVEHAIRLQTKTGQRGWVNIIASCEVQHLCSAQCRQQ